ncbi:MAG: family 43 glycosylhydrolase [Bacteroidaceae bacterium]|nr:family 43 glycosylhydrolase [Bacteroidaceae bacterium]
MKKKSLVLLFSIVAGVFLCCQSGSHQETAGDGSFRNPVLPGFHPDPSVCRVGEDFYLVNSTFQFFPGVPIYHSRDLIHWEQIGHCLTRRSQLELRDADFWGGIYAPTIRYHEGRFYMITTNCTNGGNFFVTAENPAGPWSDPVWVDQGGIDPTLFFDGGKTYYVGCDDGIVLFEIDPTNGKRLTPSKKIWEGMGGRYPEGPHLYKKDGWYYLLIAEGGTEMAHSVTIARSKNIWGPYKSNPDNPILTHCSKKGQYSIIQGLGHADLVEASDSSWWSVFLGFRWQTGSHHLLGRETFLAPVVWEKGKWPIVNGGNIITEEMKCRTLPSSLVEEEPTVIRFEGVEGNAVETFVDNSRYFRLNFLCNPIEENYLLQNDRLRLFAGDKDLDAKGSPTFVGWRQTDINEKTSIRLDAQGLREGSRAGVTVYANGAYHYDVAIILRNGTPFAQVRYRLGNLTHVEREVPLSSFVADLSIQANSETYAFFCNEVPLGEMDARFLSSETAGGFTGTYFGAFCEGEGSFADVLEIRLGESTK